MQQPNYDDYRRAQTLKYLSFEHDNAPARTGLQAAISHFFAGFPNTAEILDCACGDGTSLKILHDLGFHRLAGVDLSPIKLAHANILDPPVTLHCEDMHDLSIFPRARFDHIFSSHSLEHAYNPQLVLAEFHRILRPGGRLCLVLPFPDLSHGNLEAHLGKHALHLDQTSPAPVLATIENAGFRVDENFLRTTREPELWLTCFS